jgi:hypothetical protein
MHDVRTRRRVRDALVALCSAAVVALGVLYLFAPSRPRLAMTVHDEGVAAFVRQAGEQPPALLAASPRAPRACRGSGTEVLYGAVKAAHGVRISTTTIAVRTLRGQTCASVVLHHTGTYRSVLHLPPHLYRLRITVVAEGATVSDTRPIRLRDRHAYRASVTVESSSLFAFLPISSY